MTKALLLYCSHDGQTRTIVSRIHERLAGTISADMHDIRQQPPHDLSGYQAVLIGAAIRYGHFHRDVWNYAARHAAELNSLPSAFLGVCLTARKPDKRTPASNAYLRKFLTKTPWRPGLAAAAAGALLYPRYCWYDRLAIQMIMRLTGGETDPSREIVYTDWQQVDDFADSFIGLATGKSQS